MHAAHPYIQPTQEELTMTSIPEVPGAAAVILDYEETDDDVHLHQFGVYERIKILSEKGKEYADVELRSTEDIGTHEYFTDTYDDIGGRTIHSDGTVIPFTGKPYVKTLEKTNDYKYQAKVFTLPDVQVGSIIEFHYSYHYPEYFVDSP